MCDSIKSFLNEAASTALEEARDDLRTAKQEVSQLSFAVREVSKEKEEAQRAVEELRKQLEQVSASLTVKEAEAKAASDEVELTLIQLHQVQEELEYYFLLYRRQAEILTSSENFGKRSTALIASLVQ